EGCDNFTDCKYYNAILLDGEEINNVGGDFTKVSWTGNSFGLEDLKFLTASSKTIMVGVTGAASAGKTTFLASLYCLIRNGEKIGDYDFAGSLTLNGWEDIAWYLG
ncbi:TRAFAC clade GTPase domain-containing protein, partial [Paraburkholderia sp. SIMBA_027]